MKEAGQDIQAKSGPQVDVRPEQADQVQIEAGERPEPEQLDAPIVPGIPSGGPLARHLAGEENVMPETQAAHDISKQQTLSAQNSDGPAEGQISETIRKMAQSPAILPGESSEPIISENAADHPPCLPVEDKKGGRQATRRRRRNVGLSQFLSMCAKDFMQNQVLWAGPDETVQQALAKMQQHDTGYIMVGADGALEGIVSRSDVTGALSPYLRPLFAKWCRPLDDATLKIKLKWIMSRPVRTIKPQTPLVTIMENVCRFGGRALPVVDEQGKVIGLVTVFDVFQMLLNTYADVSIVGRAPQTPPLA